MSQLFKQDDLKEVFDNQLSTIETLKKAQGDFTAYLEQAPPLRKSVEANFELAQQNLLQIQDDLKAIHSVIRKYKALQMKIDTLN